MSGNNFNYNGSWRWTDGHILVADLTTAFNVTSFARADDQPDMVDWVEPSTGSELYSDAADTVEAMDGSLGDIGNGNVRWSLVGLSPHMVNWLRTEKFNGKKSELATIMTFDATRGWIVVQCTAQWPMKIDSLRRTGRIFDEFPITFVDTVVIT